ncbi:MAG TPA: Maf family nucleotide pyrophosphatase [Gammaproteobacteria bacterium]|nr:Maf family nucleotide pyrophosphatase [Gammaproteobacteria bacterium]
MLLASTSRYRRELLGRLGLPFEVRPPAADEAALPGEAPERMAARLAAAKAQSIAASDAIVIGSDQVASLDGRLLRKPGRHDAALAQLEDCQGKTVVFHTGVFVLDAASGRSWVHVDETDVRFARRPRRELDRYLAIERPYDCVGSFKAEGLGIALFERIESRDPTALLGLPLIWLAGALREAGLDPLAPARGRS